MGFEVQPYEPPAPGTQNASDTATPEADADAAPDDDGGDDEPKRPRLTIVK